MPGRTTAPGHWPPTCWWPSCRTPRGGRRRGTLSGVQRIPALTSSIRKALRTGLPTIRRVLGVDRADGERVWLSVTCRLLNPQDRDRSPVLVSFSDITAQRVITQRLAHQAAHDALTGLPNRAHIVETMRALQRGAGGLTAVLFIDLDDLKTVNDTPENRQRHARTRCRRHGHPGNRQPAAPGRQKGRRRWPTRRRRVRRTTDRRARGQRTSTLRRADPPRTHRTHRHSGRHPERECEHRHRSDRPRGLPRCGGTTSRSRCGDVRRQGKGPTREPLLTDDSR